MDFKRPFYYPTSLHNDFLLPSLRVTLIVSDFVYPLFMCGLNIHCPLTLRIIRCTLSILFKHFCALTIVSSNLSNCQSILTCKNRINVFFNSLNSAITCFAHSIFKTYFNFAISENQARAITFSGLFHSRSTSKKYWRACFPFRFWQAYKVLSPCPVHDVVNLICFPI